MKPGTGRGRRRFKRRTLRVLVDYQTREGIRYDYATTLGAGGLFIDTAEPLAVGTALRLRLRLNGSDPLRQIEGRVVWQRLPSGPDASVQGPGMAVEFTDAAACASLARALEKLP